MCRYLLYLVTIGLIAFALKLNGFCFSRPGWLSDRELIETAFRYESEGRRQNQPAIQDLAEYLRDYPRCCSVSRSGIFVQDCLYSNALFGRRFFEVSIVYPVADPAANQGEPAFEAILVMDCCGAPVVDRYGMQVPLPMRQGETPLRRAYGKRLEHNFAMQTSHTWSRFRGL